MLNKPTPVNDTPINMKNPVKSGRGSSKGAEGTLGEEIEDISPIHNTRNPITSPIPAKT
jgi:hypothetical protein